MEQSLDLTATGTTDLVQMPDSGPATLESLPSEILAQIAENLAATLKFAALLKLRLSNKAIGDIVARVLQLRAARVLIFYFEQTQRATSFLAVTCTEHDENFLPLWRPASIGICSVPYGMSMSVEMTGLKRFAVKALVHGHLNVGSYVWAAWGPDDKLELPSVGIFETVEEAIGACLHAIPDGKSDVVVRQGEDKAGFLRNGDMLPWWCQRMKTRPWVSLIGALSGKKSVLER
jgi:hypothetical protein